MVKHPTCFGCNTTIADRGVHTFTTGDKHNPVRVGFCEHCIACPHERSNLTLMKKGDYVVFVKDDNELVTLLKDWGYE